jgi:hypothetical protein
MRNAIALRCCRCGDPWSGILRDKTPQIRLIEPETKEKANEAWIPRTAHKIVYFCEK